MPAGYQTKNQSTPHYLTFQVVWCLGLFQKNRQGQQLQRITQQYTEGSNTTAKLWAGACEYITENGQATTHTYLSGPEGVFALHIIYPNGSDSIRYIHKDHLGSWHTITYENGNLLQELSFDAWGNRRNPATWRAFTGTPPEPLFDRGFTGHEHLYAFSLINMNGRMYDPLVSRMLSPDNFIQAPDFSQSFNRYSYVWNNPLVYTDPDGEFITWSIGRGGFSIGFNLTPILIPLGAGINIGWGDGASAGVYGEVGYRVGGTGLGSGVTVSQSLDYNHKYNSWSTTTSEGAYASFGLFNAGINFSQTYDITNKQWSNSWGVSAGVGVGNDQSGIGLFVGYGSGGWNYGLGGYYNPPRPEIYRSPISSNYGTQSGECALRCLEEFSYSYGMGQYDYEYWFEQNDNKLGVHARDVKALINNTGVFSSDQIIPQANIYIIAEAFTADQRVMMGFQTTIDNKPVEHAVMVRKVKIWPSGRYKVYFSETSPVRIAPRSSSNLYRLQGTAFWNFYPN